MSGEISDLLLIPKIVDFQSTTQEVFEQKETKNQIETEKLDVLFNLNLNDLLNVQLNGTENLKNNFQAIIDAIASNFSVIKQLKSEFTNSQDEIILFREKITGNFNQINKINEINFKERQNQLQENQFLRDSLQKLQKNFEDSSSKQAQQILLLQESLQNVPSHSQIASIQEKVDNLQEQLENWTKSQDNIQNQIDSLKNQLDQFFSMAMKGGDDMGPVQMKMQSFQLQLDDLLKQLKDLATQKELHEIKQNVKKVTMDVETMTNQHLPVKVRDLEQKVNHLDSQQFFEQIEEFKHQLKQKVAISEYVPKINQIEQKLASIGSGTPRVVSSGDDKISKSDLMVLERIPFLEELIQKLGHMMEATTENLNKLKQQQEDDMKQIQINKLDKNEFKNYDDQPQKIINKEVQGQLTSLKDNVSRINQKIASEEMQMIQFEERLNKLSDALTKIQDTIQNLNVDNSKHLEAEFKKITDGLIEQINNILSNLEKRATKGDIQSSEEGLLQKLDKCIEALIKKMADKNDTKKVKILNQALLFLEKRINDLYQLSFDKKQTNDDDPLIAKRPLFWSCVSCDIDTDKVKYLQKYRGKLGDYKNWAVFPPKETTPDRMGRFGIGYYNMMRNRKLGLQNEREKLTQLNLMDSKDGEELNVKSLEGLNDAESQGGKSNQQKSISKAKQ